MTRGSRRIARVAVLGACLVLATSACQLDINAITIVNRDGSGRFALRFVVDRELADLARNAGQDTLSALCDISQELSARGWRVARSTVGGGLQLELERAFSGPADLQTALDDLSKCLTVKAGSGSRFFDLRLRRSSSFLKTSTALEGSVDLTGEGLLGRSNLDDASKRQLQTLIERTGSEFFSFSLGARLPGRASGTEGDPTVKGGTVTWSPQLGRRLTFASSSSSYSPAAFGILVGVIAAAAAVVAVSVVRRRGPETVPPLPGA